MASRDNLFPEPDDRLEALVRAQLEAEAGRTQGDALWVDVLERLDADAVLRLHRRRGRRQGVLALLTLAAAVLLLLTLVPAHQPAQATPTALVQAARWQHMRGVDRCYAVDVDLPPALRERMSPLLQPNRTVRLWTRGDRYVVQPGFTQDGAWGRDERGHIWFAPTPMAAARFREDELPLPLRRAASLGGLELSSLLGELLSEFELSWRDRPQESDAVVAITARRRSRNRVPLFWIANAELIVDRQTEVIESLRLTRHLPSGAIARIVFRLEATAVRGDDLYRAEGHLQPGAPVHDAQQPVARRRLLLNQLGHLFSHGL